MYTNVTLFLPTQLQHFMLFFFWGGIHSLWRSIVLGGMKLGASSSELMTIRPLSPLQKRKRDAEDLAAGHPLSRSKLNQGRALNIRPLTYPPEPHSCLLTLEGDLLVLESSSVRVFPSIAGGLRAMGGEEGEITISSAIAPRDLCLFHRAQDTLCNRHDSSFHQLYSFYALISNFCRCGELWEEREYELHRH